MDLLMEPKNVAEKKSLQFWEHKQKKMFLVRRIPLVVTTAVSIRVNVLALLPKARKYSSAPKAAEHNLSAETIVKKIPLFVQRFDNLLFTPKTV